MIRQNGRSDRSVPVVLQDIASNLEDIARSEFLLAKTEIKEEAVRVAKASRTLGAGIILAFFAVGFLLLAAVYALATVLAVWLAALAVGVAVGVIALVLITKGRTKLRAYAQSQKAIESLPAKENRKWTKTQSRSEDTLRNDATASATTSAN